MRQPLEQLEQRIGYKFNDPDLLVTAMTHRSASSTNYERLEFLGDAVLSLVISTELYNRFAEEKEGRLSRMRASLVKGDTLAEIARENDFGDYVRLGSGELKSGGQRRNSILADTVEAFIGAVYLDSGWKTVQPIILELYGERINNAGNAKVLKDPKTRLQELLQARRSSLPEYNVTHTAGEAHDQTFTVECRIEGADRPFSATGSSRRKAEQSAAEQALNHLQK